jgi:hypothetical protein
MPDRDSPKEKMEAQFARASISKRDFEEAEEYLRSFRDDYTDSVKRAIIVAATVSYARPFTENDPRNEGRSTPMLTVRPTKLLTPDERTLHERLLNIRHEAIAHSAYSRKAARRVPGTELGFVVESKLYDILSEPIDVQLFLALCKKLSYHCFDLMHALNSKLSSDEDAIQHPRRTK